VSPVFVLQSNKRGACNCGLRGSNQTSTHEPDLDNANVGIPEIQVF